MQYLLTALRSRESALHIGYQIVGTMQRCLHYFRKAVVSMESCRSSSVITVKRFLLDSSSRVIVGLESFSCKFV